MNREANTIEMSATHEEDLTAHAAQAAKNAQVKARALAEALGVRLGRLLHARDHSAPDHKHEVRFGAPAGMMRVQKERVDLGMELTHKKRVAREVWLTYAVES